MRHLIFIPLLFFSALGNAQQVVAYPSKSFTYHLYQNKKKCKSDDIFTVDSIEITNAQNQRVQVIKPNENSIPCSADTDGYFQIVDANFDGYEDILLMQFLPAAPNLPYYYWLYNPKSKQFEEDTSLENITSPEFDSASQQIFSTWRSSCCDQGSDTYKYINNEPVLIEQVELISDPEGIAPDTTITRKLAHGKLKEVKREIGKK